MKEQNMNQAGLDQLLETARRRPLTADEEARWQACLAEDPSAKAAWEEEMALIQLLRRLPDAPLASNFTARVLHAVEREGRKRRRAPKIFRWLGLRRPARPLAAAGALLALLVLFCWQYQSVRREKIAMALAQVGSGIDTPSEAVALAPDELWENFDAIYRLPQPQADQELLAVLKEAARK